MTEEENKVVEAQEVQPQQAEETPQVESKQEEAPKADVEKNWHEVHQVLKMQKQKIEELESRWQQSQKPVVQEEKDEFADLDPEEYLTVDKARKMAEKLAEKKATEAARKIVQEYSQQQNVQSDEQRMRTKHDDYDYVIENFAIPQIKNDPALAYKIQHSKNPAEAAYKLGKLSDSYEDQMTKQQTSPKAEKIMKNTSRPVSGNAVGSPLKTQADNFSKMSKQDVWEASQKYARGA